MATTRPIVLITGANRGIGYTLAETLARDHSFQVIIGARSKEAGSKAAEELNAKGLSIDSVVLDLTSDEKIAAAAREVEEKYGKIDVLVNNAAVMLDASEVTGAAKANSQRQLFRETFETNVFGTAAVTTAFTPLLSRSTLPRILFLSSTVGSITHRADPTSIYNPVDVEVYRSSKAALNMYAAGVAGRYREEGWKVNVACPGYVKTEINRGHGMLEVEECMPNLVKLCTLDKDGKTGTFTDANGTVPW